MHRPLFLDVQLRSWAAAVLLLAVAGACSDTVAPERGVAGPRGPSLSVVASSPTLETFFGPERFTRGRGAPETFTRQIPTTGFEAPFVLHVRSGDLNGANRVSSATVGLGGNIVLAPSAFSQQQSEWTLPVTLGGTAELSVSLASVPGSYLEIWVEGKRSATLFCPDGRAGAIGDLREAIAATPAGGTVLVCSGTHTVSNVLIGKPLTIEGIGPTKPILDAGGVSFSLGIFGAVGGPVRMRGLRFENGTWAEVMVQGPTDTVVIEDSDFYPGTQSPGSPLGVYAGVKTQQAAPVLIQNNTFTGGDIGVSVHQKSTGITILNNSFTNQGNAIHAGDQSSLRIEHNSFSNCDMCIGSFDANAPGSTMEILGNSIRVDFSRPTGNGIQLAVGTYRIDDNVISGSGGSRDPNNNLTWPIRYAGIAVEGRASLSGNRISGAWTGVSFGEWGTEASGSDNTISDVGAVMKVYKAISVTLHRNDFTGYANAIQYINTPGTVSLTCNWWGSASGPGTLPGNVTPSTYAPWATQPIAGTDVSCDPAAPVTAMRVCSTAINGGPMTAATFPQAYNFVAAGGTISFCAGTHTVSNASIAKPLTVTSESGAMATLDGGAASMVFFVSNGDAAGAVNLTRLRFTGGTSSNVAVGSNAGTVNVSANEFNPPRTGLDCNDFSILNIENNRFVGGNVGVNIDSRSGAPSLRGNTFENQNDASIGLHGSLPGPILVERNTFRGCGPTWCLFTELAVTAVANTVEIEIGRPTHSPLFISNSHGGTSVVTDNVIIGLGVGGTDRTSQSSYPIRSYAVHVVGAGRVERNRVTNAYSGFGATPASLTASDNVIEHTYAPFGGGGDPSTSTITATRNDLSDYMVTLNSLGVFSTVSLKCNYWGSASGPTGITGDPAWYVPFSAQPIASKPAVTCP